MRRKRTTEDEWYDIFMAWDVADQQAAIRMLEQLCRQKRRGKIGEPLLSEAEAAAAIVEGAGAAGLKFGGGK